MNHGAFAAWAQALSKGAEGWIMPYRHNGRQIKRATSLREQLEATRS